MQTIGADDVARARVLDEEMIAALVKLIGIKATEIGGIEAFVELKIEDLEAQALGGDDVDGVAGQPDGVAGGARSMRPRGLGKRVHVRTANFLAERGLGELRNVAPPRGVHVTTRLNLGGK